MEIFSLCRGVCCFGTVIGGWLTLSKAAKLPAKATVIGGIILCTPFCLGGFFVGKYMFLDEQLVMASYEGDLEQMKMLLDLGANPNIKGEFKTPICAAFANDHVEAVKLLANHGANLNQGCGDSTSELGYPLDIAADRQNWKLVEFLKSKGAKRRLAP